MASIIEKRKSLHKAVYDQRKENDKLKFHLSHLQGLANIGTTTAMVAHEINNLLTPIANYADLALMHPDDSELSKKALTKVSRNCKRAAQIMESLLKASRCPDSDKDQIDLKEVIDEVFSCLARDFAKDRIHLDISIPEHLTVWAVRIQLQQVFMNLILNARRAMLQAGGTLTIKAEQTSDTVEIRLSDTGDGIEPEDLKRIFEPFFSTVDRAGSDDEYSGGSGLGLLFCKQVLDDHGGSISAESTPGRGTSFRLAFPKPGGDDS